MLFLARMEVPSFFLAPNPFPEERIWGKEKDITDSRTNGGTNAEIVCS